MSEQSEPWWKAVLTTFLNFLSTILSSNSSTAKATEIQAKANEVENRIDAASSSELDSLRTKWTRSSSDNS